jgi:hypothetical protein
MTLVNYFPDFLLLLRDVQGQSQTVAQRQADAKTAQVQIGNALDTLRYVPLPVFIVVCLACLTLVEAGFLPQWDGHMDLDLMTKTKRFTLVSGGRRGMHSEPQTDFSTCCGACGLKAHAVNHQTPILAPACNIYFACPPLSFFVLSLIRNLRQSSVL